MYLDCPINQVAKIAADVSAVLNTLQGELSSSLNPHRLVLRHLGMTNSLEGVRRTYHDDAFNAWAEMLKRDPNDVDSLHHLAIMHYARAYDLEIGAKPKAADDDWNTGHDYWHRLWKSKDFWSRVLESLDGYKDKRTAVIDELRNQFPVDLLRLHYDLALDFEHTKTHRAKFHLNLLSRTPFPAEARTAAQQGTYADFVRSIPATVWQSDMLDEAELKKASNHIESYLQLDPTCVSGLEDALRLHLRQVRAWAMNLAALGQEDPGKRKSLLQLVRSTCEHWRPYFASLAGNTTISTETRGQLGTWMATAGDVYCALDMESTAVEYYAMGVQATAPDSDELVRCQKELGRTHCYLAREAAHKGDANSRNICDSAAKYILDAKACFLLANAYKLIHEYDLGEQACRRGLELELDISNVDAMDASERDRQHLQDMLDDIAKQRIRHAGEQLIKRAMEHVHNRLPQEALPLMDQAIATAPDAAEFYIVRCQCRLILGRADEAEQDLLEFRKRHPDAPVDVIAPLQKEIDEKLQMSRRLGKSAFELVQKASEARARDDYAAAERALREAHECCSFAGKADVSNLLAMTLKNWSIDMVNHAMEHHQDSPTELKRAANDAMVRMEEAQRLAPHDENIHQQLKQLEKLHQQLDQAHLVERMVAEYGGMEVFKVRQKAVEAFNNDRFDDAIAHARHALQLSNGASKLREELSDMLESTAVANINNCASRPSSSTLIKSLKYLKEAVEMNPSNHTAREKIDQVTRMMSR